MYGKKNINNVGRFIGICFCGASQEAFHSIALWLSFRVYSSEANDSITAYLRKIVHKMQQHYRCVPERCLKGYGGKRLHTCKYGFPFAVPQD